jgi:PKD repeat protein
MNMRIKLGIFFFITPVLCISGVSTGSVGSDHGKAGVLQPVSQNISADDDISGHLHHNVAASADDVSGAGTMDLPEGSGYNPSTFAWSVPSGIGLNFPWGITTDNAGNINVADDIYYKIWKFSPDRMVLAEWGSYGTGNGQFAAIAGITVNSSGYVYAVDKDNNRVQLFNPTGDYVSQWGSNGVGNGVFDAPIGLTVNSSDYVYVADSKNYRVQVFDPNGTYVSGWGSAGNGNGQFMNPCDIAVDHGNAYITDLGNSRIQKYTVVMSRKVIHLPDYTNPPVDPDLDGLYEDVNGDGKTDSDDVTAFFKSLDWIVINEPIAAFDFTTNSGIEFDDIVRLNKKVCVS